MIAAARCRRTDCISQIYAMCFAESMYNIWLQRNAKVFDGHCQTVDVLFRGILFRVACRCPDHLRQFLFI